MGAHQWWSLAEGTETVQGTLDAVVPECQMSCVLYEAVL